MLKKITLILVLMLLTFGSVRAQLILNEDDAGLSPRSGRTTGEFSVMVPVQNLNYDQFTEEIVPLGEGFVLLLCMGGLYGIKKNKEKKNKRSLK